MAQISTLILALLSHFQNGLKKKGSNHFELLLGLKTAQRAVFFVI
jgi:hypothetical protein